MAGGFPSRVAPVSERVDEITRAVEAGAQEIDTVLDRAASSLEADGTLLAVGDRPAATDLDAAALAAWTSLARVLLNLHETITRD